MEMEIQREITKQVFESYVPAAKMPERNDSVFERLQTQFNTVYQQLLLQVVGEEYESQFDTNELLKGTVVRFVCLQAFVNTIRSLDVVLTATGFGIVSTPSMAPASKNRVDALRDDCRLHATESLHHIVSMLIKTEGWGLTLQARQTVQTLFWSIFHMTQFTWLPYTADSWQQARGRALIADAFLRKAISTEYMDELLQKIRTNALNENDVTVMNMCNTFTGGFISSYDTEKRPNQQQLDNIMQQLETYPDEYPTYVQSETYKARHAERYQNRKEDPTFFFM